jgi:hypothetical protein
MDVERIQIKIYAQPGYQLHVDQAIRTYHRWIKERVLPEQLIDVADYSHVHHGPSVVLVGHSSDYYWDNGEGRTGLLFFAKRSGPPPAERLKDAFKHTLSVAKRLESEPEFTDQARFSTRELLFRVVDRLNAPNTEEGFAPLRAELRSFVQDLYKVPVTIERFGTASQPLSVRITAPNAADLDTLLERLGGSLFASSSKKKERSLKIA